MQSLKEIIKFVETNKRKGYSGHQKIKNYLKEFTNDELDFLDTSFKLGMESSERLMAFKDVIPLSIAIYAVLASLIPDVLKENFSSFSNLLLQFLLISVFALVVYLLLNNYPSKQIDTYRTGLEIINRIKEERNN